MTLLAVLFLFVGGVMAQTKVNGTVVSQDDGQPVIGATVIVVGTNVGTATNGNGQFSLTCPAGKNMLRITYVGMEPLEVSARPNMRILLTSDQKALDEVIVVAYGTAKKSQFTGAAAAIDASKIEVRQVSNLSNALAGNIAGVTATSATGQPGTSATIRVRGFGSINAGMNPLYVVDGMPYDGDMSAIDPQDIEQISVLKDAAAAALYGARGANGVIMVTTKRGRVNSEAKVSFEASWGSNSREITTMDVIENTNQYYEQLYRTNYNQALYNLGYSPANAHDFANTVVPGLTGYRIYTLPDGENMFGVDGTLNPNAQLGYSDGEYYYTPDDWQKESFRNGLRQEYKASVNGGSDRLAYYFGAGYLKDEGVIVGSGFERISTRLNVEYKLKDWLKLRANVSYTNSTSNYPDDQTTSNSSGNAFGVAATLGPVYPFYTRDANGQIMYNGNTPVYDYGDGTTGNFTRNTMAIANPIGDLAYQTNEYLMDIFNSRWGVDINPIEGLTLTYNLGINLDNTRFHMATSPLYGQSKASGGEAEQVHDHVLGLTQQYMATYRHTFAEKHSLDVLGVYETYDYKSEESTAYGKNLYRAGSWAVNNAIDNRRGYGSEGSYAMRSWIGRINYDFMERYFASVSLRTDGSSRFHKDNRWGTFWSVSGAWNLGKEKFLQDVKWIDFLKLRVSFGQQGNDNIGNSYAYVDQYSMTGSDGVFSDATLTYKGNKELTWEKSNAFDLAVDFEFWNGKLSGSLDYYNRTTSDMLYNKPVALSNGYATIPMNIGSMRNRGIELELHSKVISTKDLTWNVDFNITHNSNKILELAPDLEGELIDGSRIYREGHSMYEYYLVKYAGVDPTTGMALYWAKDDNDVEYATTDWSVARTSNRQATGNLQPKFTGGFGTTLQAYGFDFSVQASFQMGGKLYDNGYNSLMHAGTSSTTGQAWHKDILNAWTPTNTNTNIPRIAVGDLYTNSQSDRWLVSSNYLSLNNITLGYTLPKSLTNQIKIDGVRVYCSADNVALFSARKGLDPRISVISSQNKYYSAIRSITGGVKVTF
ncbi:MAG: TonB-dependent receptor [Prevotella sp.]|nr:TonB-dependent receptor [Prevotella sp.]